MVQKYISRTRVAAVILGCVGLVIAASSAAADAQAAPGVVAAASESPSDALARHLRVLATSPRNFQALIGAGRAALALGDSQAAAGFFGRADEVWPTSSLPHIGMGAAAVLDGDAQGALAYFGRAQSLGGSAVTMGADRGLAYDLLGRHSEAQADYRAALAGTEASEARRRLALSLAITGDKNGALETLNPLLLQRDPGAVRVRALVLALTGDENGARVVIDAAMPGAWPQMAPFLGRLASLNSGQKAAAVNLGIFPGSGQSASGGDRLAAIDALLHPPATPTASVPQQAPAPAYQQPPATAYQLPAQPRTVAVAPGGPALAGPRVNVAGPPAPQASAATATTAVSTAGTLTATPRRRYWVQLASGPDANALPEQLRKIRGRTDDLLNGISGYIAQEQGRARLLIGPFRNSSDADIFAEELENVNVDAFRWISAEGQPIRKLGTE